MTHLIKLTNQDIKDLINKITIKTFVYEDGNKVNIEIFSCDDVDINLDNKDNTLNELEKIISKLEGKIEAYENVLKITNKSDDLCGLPF